MADITMCKGVGCPMKEQCYRYTAIPDEIAQSYLVNPPLKVAFDGTLSKCEMFWGDRNQEIIDLLKKIFK
jgi:hypothetical protein